MSSPGPSSLADPVSPERRRRIDAARESWARSLIDFSRNNPLLYYRERKAGAIDLPELKDAAVQQMLAGNRIDGAALLGHALDPKEFSRFREAVDRARVNEEERGLETLFLAIGMATWPATDGGRPTQAPTLLCPVAIELNGRRGEVVLQRTGDLQINDVLLEALTEDFGLRIDPEDVLGGDESREASDVLEALRAAAAAAQVAEFSIQPRCLLSNFEFQKLAMWRDLRDHGDVLAASDLVSAIAGDPEALTRLRDAHTTVEARELDEIPPREELFILDADSSQQRVIHGVLRSPQASGVIQGPPGTGKSQTIANLMAALVGAGQRVLFVSEKRAALEVVRDRLDREGLGHLVLDLHGADIKRTKVYEQLRHTDQVARQSPPVDDAMTHARVVNLRDKLNAHDACMNEVRPGSGLSLYEIQGRLLRTAAEAKSVTTIWYGPQVERLDAAAARRISELLVEAHALPSALIADGTTPWSRARLERVEEAEGALQLLDRLQGDLLPSLRDQSQLAFSCAVFASPTNIPEAERSAGLLTCVAQTRARFGETILGEDVPALLADLAPAVGSWLDRVLAVFRGSYRAALRRCPPSDGARPAQIHASLKAWSELPPEWRTAELFQAVNGGTAEAYAAAGAAVRPAIEHLTSMVGAGPADDGFTSVDAWLSALQRTRYDAYTVVRIREIELELRAFGVDALLLEFAQRQISADRWAAKFERAWLRSWHEYILARDARARSFDASALRCAVDEFCQVDRRRLALAGDRIRRQHGETYTAARNAYPEEDRFVQLEMRKKTRQKPLRRLLRDAPHVLGALCPCWMASPLSISLFTEPRVQFDVVIFDEASQVLPEDAISAIMRGRRTIVAGDSRQLPPTTFFTAADTLGESEDGDAGDLSGVESILDLMETACGQSWRLEWHYRSRDERLIAFSNEHIYQNSLLTFPTVGGERAVSHVLVEGFSRDGEEESSSAEVARVVELILEHAAQRPNESLGVIAMGIKHAQRIEGTLREACNNNRADLDAFFSQSRKDRFFVKNLERVQGDERDAIILSVGYGKDRAGKMLYRFGPLNFAGGERRLNVAITRARCRMTVVSSFSAADLDPKRLNAPGAKLLRAYIEFASSEGRLLGREGAASIPPNPFEEDVCRALESRGLSIIPQWGASAYRIDLAVQYPDEPGRFVFAIECDGATYHSAPTARDRDRLRQQHLEALGWTFHRIWSTDWFRHRDEEIERALAAYWRALNAPTDTASSSSPTTEERAAAVVASTQRQRGRRPLLPVQAAITKHQPATLIRLMEWIESDGILRSDDELIDETIRELGFQRRGAQIQRVLRSALTTYRSRRQPA